MLKRFLSAVLSIVIILTAIPTVYCANATTKSSIQIGDYLLMGKYYGESILWRCVDIDENGPLMLSDRILCLKEFDSPGHNPSGSHERAGRYVKRGNTTVMSGSNYWGDSNIRSWLNSEAGAGDVVWLCGNPPETYADEAGFLSGFSDFEKSFIKEVYQKNILYKNEYFQENDAEIYDSLKLEINDIVRNYENAYSEFLNDRVFLLDVKQLGRVYDNSNILGERYYHGRLSSSAIKSLDPSVSINHEYFDFSEGSEWDTWTRTPDFASNVTISLLTYFVADYVSTQPNPKYIESINPQLVNSQLGIRPAFYLSDQAIFNGDGSEDRPFSLKQQYNIDNVPKIKCDGYDANFANFNGMYVDSFEYSNNTNGTTNVKFDVYNTTYIYGVVEAYDADGEIYDVQTINKMSNPSSIKGVLIDSTGMLIRDIFSGDLLTYRQESGYSKKTSIDIDVPNGGYIKITNDMIESYIACVINFADIAMGLKSTFSSLKGFGDNSSNEFAEKISLKMIKDSAYNEILRNPSMFTEKLWKNVSKKIYFTPTYITSFINGVCESLDNFTDADLASLIFNTASSCGISIAEKTFKSFAGPVGVALDTIFTITTVTDVLIEIDDATSYLNCGSIEIHTDSNHTNGTGVIPTANEIPNTTPITPTMTVAEGMYHAGQNYFYDVPLTARYAEGVNILYGLGVMQGYPDGTFRPHDLVTRAEMVAIISRYFGLTEIKGDTGFNDVPSSHWAAGYINAAKQSGIINGIGDGRFAPDEYVKYEQAVKMIVCGLGLEDEANALGGYFDGYRKVASERWITTSTISTWGNVVTRADIATMLYNSMIFEQ